MEPWDFQKMMDVTILVEDWSVGGETSEEGSENVARGGRRANGQFQAQQGRQAQQTGQGQTQQKNWPSQSATTSHNAPSTKPNQNRLKDPFRRLTLVEVAIWKAEGLCFQCDEKYNYNHWCMKAELVVMMVLEDGTEIDVSNCSVEVEEESPPEEVEVAEISISLIVGISKSRTIKVEEL